MIIFDWVEFLIPISIFYINLIQYKANILVTPFENFPEFNRQMKRQADGH